jgi:plasmid stability protein
MTEIRILKVPEDLKRALKVRAAAEDKGFNDLILEILTASVEKANSKAQDRPVPAEALSYGMPGIGGTRQAATVAVSLALVTRRHPTEAT